MNTRRFLTSTRHSQSGGQGRLATAKSGLASRARCGLTSPNSTSWTRTWDDKQDVEDVKAGTNNVEESTKGKQEVVALQAAVKKLTEQCQVQEAARKTEVGEAEHWRKQAQQVAQAKEEAEKELLTKDFQRLMEQHEALKERDKKKIAVLIK
ncbi:hypothetical protein PC128_g18719 [Phytophthora cactorum]|nr:hypothetical protein PC128_g18719 [Phytophthora cactorum]KAG4048079.1 hypothetical protein PC123_g16599 [Phytophthora cactorum]